MNAPTVSSIAPNAPTHKHGKRPSPPTTAVGWLDAAKGLTSLLRERLRCDRILVGVINPQHPLSDELLICDRFKKDAVQTWLDSGFRRDSILRDALRTGAGAGTAAESQWVEGGISANVSVACVALPEGYPDRRFWVTVVTRAGGAFTDTELRTLSLHSRAWAARFNRPRELGVCRVLVGHDDRLIHADPAGAAWIDSAGIDIKRVMIELREVAEQRWPDMAENQVHDVVLRLADKPVWIRFERRRALALEAAEQWYLEMRILEVEDLPPIGVIEDDRIAQAIGYLHDHFAESPSLNTISNLVEISPFHFHRTFSKLVGTTPKQYSLQKQIQMAKWILAAMRVPISVVADATGFASHGHFTSTFRRMTKLSPSEYREQVVQ